MVKRGGRSSQKVDGVVEVSATADGHALLLAA